MRRRVNCQAKSEMAANEQQQNEDREPGEPAHHARRPMNAFLIFCKRHRTSVRSHFPNLENRAVTRVLGEWWATLHPEQKQSYVDLAQEYKDAFLNANPDFKWYKLPAPPLRTLTTRPTNKKQEYDSTIESSVSAYESSGCSETPGRKNQIIQPGKLADESQIGGLSSLFTPQKQKETTDDVPRETVPKPPKKRYTELSNDIEQKRDCKADLFNDDCQTTESNNNEEHRLNQEDNKGPYLDDIDEGSYRGERSCKGLRYQKFLAEQQRTLGTIGQGTKRRRLAGDNKNAGKERRNSISSNVSEKTDSLSSEGGNSTRSDLEHFVDSAEGRVEASKPEDTETEGTELGKEYVWTARKRFKAEDFNLEKKIEALPSLSLEEFQEKKKQQRTKKKIQQKSPINSAKRQNYEQLNNNNNHQVNEPQEEERSLLVGSQKRKARKQSITRNAGAQFKEQEKNGNQPWCASPDLEALACLAELAANRTKLTK